jgi:amino acid transporter
MIYSLLICTVLYVLVALVLTGMVPYTELAVGDPLAYVFGRIGLDFISGVIAVSAVVAMASVLLVFQLGQPRIWMAMSRDGLLPKVFSRLHPVYKTPSFATIITGFVVAVPALFMNLTEVTDLTSIGTLFAFVLVCGGVLVADSSGQHKGRSGFKVPYYNAKYLIPALMVVIVSGLYVFNSAGLNSFFSLDNGVEQGWDAFKHKIPLIGFILFCGVIAVLSYTRNLSLIPVLGLITNLYLMTELGITNWSRFLIWLALGLLVYFFYGYRNSKLNR